jgi:probable HAF family extracellular repeat protein
MKHCQSNPGSSPIKFPYTKRHPERALAALSLAAAVTYAQAQTLQVIPPFPGGFYSHLTGISADGSVVAAGNVLPSGEIDRGFTWTSASGAQDIGFLPGFTLASIPTGLSGNGSTVVGIAFDPNYNLAAFRYQNGVMEDLGSLGGTNPVTQSAGVSYDGSVVTGSSSSDGIDSHAFRWTQAGMQDLGVLPGGSYSLGLAISGDGEVIVGNGNVGSDGRIFRWTQADGMKPLGFLPGSTFDGAYALSADGTTIAGVSDAQAVRWSGDVPQALGSLPGTLFSSANAVSGDGQIIGGTTFDSSFSPTAFIWSQATGMLDIEELLASRGVDMAGWSFESMESRLGSW